MGQALRGLKHIGAHLGSLIASLPLFHQDDVARRGFGGLVPSIVTLRGDLHKTLFLL